MRPVIMALVMYCCSGLLQPVHSFSSSLCNKSTYTSQGTDGDKSEGLRIYDIVFPTRVKKSGQPLNDSVEHFIKSTSDLSWVRKVSYTLTVCNRTLNLSLEYSVDFISPTLLVQHVGNNASRYFRYRHQGLHCFYHGIINNVTHNTISVSLCNGMTGHFIFNGEKYLIQPQKKRTNEKPALNSQLPHLIFNEIKHVRKENHSHCGLNDEYFKHQNKKKDVGAGRREYRSSTNETYHSRHKRSDSLERHIEVMVVADHEMEKYHEENLKHYVLTLMAMVTSIYKHHSIKNYINVVLVKLVILDSNESDLKVTSNAVTSLRLFCKWQSKRNVEDDSSEHHHDAAILLTRKDICRDGRNCETLGLAEIGTVCDMKRNCGIAEDNGLPTAFTIAHELGHLFSLPHDDAPTCKKFAGNADGVYHVMAPTLDFDTSPWTWSECSASLITKFIDSDYAECLLDKPPRRNQRTRSMDQYMPPGLKYDANLQCRLAYGKDYTSCTGRRVNTPCSRLWCFSRGRNSCRTKRAPWADGTTCGANKWCQKGECVIKRHLDPIPGNWGSWSEYDACTLPCNGGIKKSVRKCDNPVPRNGGNYCLGKRIKYKSCNTKSCPPGTEDFRAKQCSEFDGKIQMMKNVRWIPKYAGIQLENACKLYCRASQGMDYYRLKDQVIDGTRCSEETFDVCVAGKCRRAGCDFQLGSNMKRDRCGVCGGDNSSCRTETGRFTYATYGYNKVVDIPAGAASIEIRQHGYQNKVDENYLALKDSNDKFILNGDFTVKKFRHRFKVKGGSIEYSGSVSPVEQINSSSIIDEQITVFVLSVGQLDPPNIHYSYSISTGNNVKYSWNALGPWGDCDNICQGRKQRRITCTRDDGLIVSDQRCEAQPRPRQVIQQCNTHCSISWKVVHKEECSVRCGTGFQKLKIRCVRTTAANDEIVDEDYCSHVMSKPDEMIACEGQCLQSHWLYSNWSACSKTCGTGIQNRMAICIDEQNKQLADSECSVQNRITSRLCNEYKCASWAYGEWTGCSATCGHAKKHRDVWCQNDADQKLPDEHCSNENKPISYIKCNLTECPTWFHGAWGPCSMTCGVGWKKRSVRCRTIQGVSADEAACRADLKPLVLEPCQIAECTTARPPPPTEVTPREDIAKWRYGRWTECSAVCGAEGERQRYVRCTDDNGHTRDNSECEHLPRPVSVEKCSSKPCGIWQTGQWGECTVTCGEGTQTRMVGCVHLDHQVEEEKCFKDLKPVSVQVCRLQECAPVLASSLHNISNWRAGEWSGCSSTCGAGWQRRRVACNYEDPKYCNVLTKPMEKRSCNSGPCPTWNYGDWNSCSSCGASIYQTRMVLCHLPNGQVLPDPNCNLREKPAENRLCLCDHFNWHVGPWNPCPASCGKSHKVRKVMCVNDSDFEVAPSNCRGTPPKSSKRCRLKRCPRWQEGPWQSCSVTCGHGTRRREVFCHQSKNRRVADRECETRHKKPATVKFCYPGPCNFIWKKERWSACSKECGFGRKHRSIHCVDYIKGTILDEKFCQSKKPKTTRRCAEFPCPFTWTNEPWSPCSTSCGPGYQTRRVVCQAVSKEGWILKGEVYGCKSHDMPTSRQHCNMGDCSSPYHWKVYPWHRCPNACGVQEVGRRVMCVDRENREHPHHNCVQPPPQSRRRCMNRSCYASTCRELKSSTSIRQDGNYRLLVKGKLVEIYCKQMKKRNPTEFISLRSKENFSEIYDKRLKDPGTCPNNGTRSNNCNCHRNPYSRSGYTTYSKIRINLNTLSVVQDEISFAVTQQGRSVDYGTAGDCYSLLNCPQGRFQIDLTGTGFVVSRNTRWITTDQRDYKQISFSQNGEVVRGLCGGRCGIKCIPDPNIGLRLEVRH